MNLLCPKHPNKVMVESFAFVNTWVNGRGIPAHRCGNGDTISQTGPAIRVPCFKCPECGHSVASRLDLRNTFVNV